MNEMARAYQALETGGRALVSFLKPDRAPDFQIGPKDRPYMNRWYLFGGSSSTNQRIPGDHALTVMLHQILHNDDDRALHDHPWNNLTIVLAGQIRDHNASGFTDLTAGDKLYREAAWPHRLEVECFAGQTEAWTLFIAGPVIREWGFHCPAGWKHWSEFVNKDDRGAIGAGCGA